MKKVVRSLPPKEIVLLSKVLQKTNPIIGFIASGDKVTLVPTNYRSNIYFARTVNLWEIGNGYDPYGEDKKTIAQWEDFFSTTHIGSEMFIFDSPKELFKWLSE